jgi:hypothetical protein
MNKFFRSLALVLIFSIGAAAQQQWTWKTFSPPDGAWSITAPGDLKPDAEAQQAKSKKGAYTFSDFAGFFAVIYRDSPKRVVPWKANRSGYFRKVQKGIVKAGKGEILRQAEFTNGAISGREAWVKVPVGTMTGTEGQTVTKYRVQRFRMFFVGDRFYLLLALLPESDIDAATTNNFFNSFAAK